MKISDEEVKAALHIYYGKSTLPHLFGTMKRALTAALRVRKKRKRERETARELSS